MGLAPLIPRPLSPPVRGARLFIYSVFILFIFLCKSNCKIHYKSESKTQWQLYKIN